MRLDGRIKVSKKEKYTKTLKRPKKTKMIIQFEQINQKMLVKEERLKNNKKESSNTNKIGPSKITKENSAKKSLDYAQI